MDLIAEDFIDNGKFQDFGKYEEPRKILETADGKYQLRIIQYPDYPNYLPYQLINGEYVCVSNDYCFKDINAAIKVLKDPEGSKRKNKSECYNCLSTFNLLSGSLGLLCPDCYDDIESTI